MNPIKEEPVRKHRFFFVERKKILNINIIDIIMKSGYYDEKT